MTVATIAIPPRGAAELMEGDEAEVQPSKKRRLELGMFKSPELPTDKSLKVASAIGSGGEPDATDHSEKTTEARKDTGGQRGTERKRVPALELKERRVDPAEFMRELAETLRTKGERARSEAQLITDLPAPKAGRTEDEGRRILQSPLDLRAEGGSSQGSAAELSLREVPQLASAGEKNSLEEGEHLYEFADSLFLGGDSGQGMVAEGQSSGARHEDETTLGDLSGSDIHIDAERTEEALASLMESHQQEERSQEMAVPRAGTELPGAKLGSEEDGGRGEETELRVPAESNRPDTSQSLVLAEVVTSEGFVRELGQADAPEASFQLQTPDSPANPFSTEQLECMRDMLMQFFRTNLSGGWSVAGFSKRLGTAIDGYEALNKSMVEMVKMQSELVDEVKKMKEEAKTSAKFVPTLMEIGKDQEEMKEQLKKWVRDERDRRGEQQRIWEEDEKDRKRRMDDLCEEVNRVSSMYEFLSGEHIKFGAEFDTYKRELAKNQVGMTARLEGLESSRRNADLRVGSEDIVESNRLRMEGFEFCIHCLISRRLFPRVLLEDQAFMDLIRDKEGLVMALARADNQARLEGGRELPEPRQQHRDYGPTQRHDRYDASGSSRHR